MKNLESQLSAVITPQMANLLKEIGDEPVIMMFNNEYYRIEKVDLPNQ